MLAVVVLPFYGIEDEKILAFHARLPDVLCFTKSAVCSQSFCHLMGVKFFEILRLNQNVINERNL